MPPVPSDPYTAFVLMWAPNLEKMPRGLVNKLRQHVAYCRDRYGDNGYGAKPEDVGVVEYWLQQMPDTSPIMKQIMSLAEQ